MPEHPRCFYCFNKILRAIRIPIIATSNNSFFTINHVYYFSYKVIHNPSSPIISYPNST